MIANRLTEIIDQKKNEVGILQELLANDTLHPLNQILRGNEERNSKKDFKLALSGSTLSVIAEIKRRSPSKGALANITDPVSLAQQYIKGHADAISILTDRNFFSGSLDDLAHVAQAIANEPVPILRKDFIIDRVQLAEALYAGADAVLLIVAVLGKETKALLAQAQELGLQALVEIHDERELDIAVESGAEIIGINNRNLTTFMIDTQQAFKLGARMPGNIIKVAESGILEPSLARDYHAAGFDAVLIGEALVKAEDPAEFIRECKR